jgi:ribosomal protein S18 acetylase RimI-like enzyme
MFNRMSSKPRLYDRLTNIRFNRLGDDYNNTYRLFELNLLPNKPLNDVNYDRWTFFDHTLRDLFEMPNARFSYSIKNCMENHGIAYAFVPLNATSVTANISAMTILTRKNNSMDSIYMCYMATRKEHRRRGLATRLLQQTVHRALNEQPNGIKYITLNVNTLNTAAIQLYERCGWRCYGYLPGFLDPEPHHVTNHAYALILRLDNVKNVTSLCRESNAIDIEPFDNEHSIKTCGREPVQF